jgi:hypothetical protein
MIKNAINSVLAVVLWFTVSAAAATAQAVGTQALPPGWDRVLALSVDSEVEIQMLTGRTAKGRLVSAEPMAVTIAAGNRHDTLRRDEIRRVALIGRHQTARLAKRGLIIGAIAGGVWGGVAARSNRAVWSLMLAGGWGAIGAVIGATDGARQRERAVVYEFDGNERD